MGGGGGVSNSRIWVVGKLRVQQNIGSKREEDAGGMQKNEKYYDDTKYIHEKQGIHTKFRR